MCKQYYETSLINVMTKSRESLNYSFSLVGYKAMRYQVLKAELKHFLRGGNKMAQIEWENNQQYKNKTKYELKWI